MEENFMILPWNGPMTNRHGAVESGNPNLFEVALWDDQLTHSLSHKIISSTDIWFSVDVLSPETHLSSIPINPSDIKSVDSNDMSSSRYLDSSSKSQQEDGNVPILQSFIDDFATVVANEEDPLLTSSLLYNEAKELTIVLYIMCRDSPDYRLDALRGKLNEIINSHNFLTNEIRNLTHTVGTF